MTPVKLVSAFVHAALAYAAPAAFAYVPMIDFLSFRAFDARVIYFPVAVVALD